MQLLLKYRTQAFLLLALLVSFVVSQASDNIDGYVLQIMLVAGINIILAVSLNLVNGHTGQFSLGHAGFMGVGAYMSAAVSVEMGPSILGLLGGPSTLSHGVTFVIALLVGGLCAAVCGWMVGVPSLRLRGDYLAIVTLGFNEIIRVVFQNTSSSGPFGGALGMRGIPDYSTFFWVFGIAAICIYVVASMVNSTYGRGFLAVRDDEVASESMGVNTVRYKVVAFVLGAFFAGLAGGLYAHLFGAIDPKGFGFLKSVDIIIMVILGGMGSTLGVVVAAIGLTALNEQLRDAEKFRMIVFSILLIVMMIVRPQGLLPVTFEKKRRKSA
ncbi:branched-chain amino acid ABC transporter permease [Verrucomicrobium sp. BvORR034]|uniref:branched-chain amino acid ABC transporter permease n=1 Tax=Verrucomicrobium sp. BvORR034 TaxID=1396418 RepID=UPI0006785D30|nr:branched-chain amino acid ABC transporter permease [Verrucomicrobium sp. BvORR034]